MAEENFLKYASENYGIDKICDYIADITENTKLTRNPARDKANAAVRDAEKTLAAAERDLAALLADPDLTPATKRPHPRPAEKISSAHKELAAAVAARNPVPAKLPASQIDPDAKTAVLRAGGAACRWSCDSSRTTPSTRYRATSTPTCATTTNTAPSPAKPSSAAWPHHRIRPRRDHRHPRPPPARRVARALTLLIDEINAAPPAMPATPAHHLPDHREPRI